MFDLKWVSAMGMVGWLIGLSQMGQREKQYTYYCKYYVLIITKLCKIYFQDMDKKRFEVNPTPLDPILNLLILSHIISCDSFGLLDPQKREQKKKIIYPQYATELCNVHNEQHQIL